MDATAAQEQGSKAMFARGEEPYIDPFGAPEYYCSDLTYLEMAGPGVVRFALHVEEGCPATRILRVKVLIPSIVIPTAILRTTTFLASHAMERIGGPTAARLLS